MNTEIRKCFITGNPIKDDQLCVYSKEFDALISKEGYEKCKEAASDAHSAIHEEAKIVLSELRWVEKDERWARA